MGTLYNRRRRPNAKAIIALVLGIIVGLSFLGVQPLATYKDAVVDWISDTSHTVGQPRIAYVERIYADVILGSGIGYICADIIPAEGVYADTRYVAELWKKGYLIQTKSISWSQSMLSSRTTLFIKFTISGEEAWSYITSSVEASDVYSVKVVASESGKES